jgi:endoglucanase
VTAGNAPINGWQVSWTLSTGQSLSQTWGGIATTAGSTVTVRNESWNGTLQPGATAQFGFLASGSATTPALTCATR